MAKKIGPIVMFEVWYAGLNRLSRERYDTTLDKMFSDLRMKKLARDWYEGTTKEWSANLGGALAEIITDAENILRGERPYWEGGRY
jgi:hypothetical protein